MGAWSKRHKRGAALGLGGRPGEAENVVEPWWAVHMYAVLGVLTNREQDCKKGSALFRQLCSNFRQKWMLVPFWDGLGIIL